MDNKLMQKFIEDHNCTFLYLILANEELKRISKLPYQIQKDFDKKLTTIALEHVAAHNIPDYFIPEEDKPEGKMQDIIDE
ncbi:MAG TPA: hypothetical protein ENG70_03760 [Candidatus Cloacimonetes bacterium]|nr:hypothetical protein [Candidatus Cloacimonadota bacterium]HEX37960.1 hypothetical protein [Candidatus Cloacimonadota bacterium]